MTEIKTFRIRNVREEDLTEVMNINFSCLPENYSLYFFQELYQKHPRAFIVAEVDGRIAGYIMCRIEHGFSDLRRLNFTKKGHVVSIAVLPEYRRMGIGGALLKEAFNGMVEYGASEAFLEVRIGNTEAVNLYGKMGLKITRVVECYYRDGESANVMTLGLKRPGTESGNPS
ncbi:MAG TPA: N-acetyltransferase [Candidatus Bathyarchaeia archaeon]|nr:N-acetyltransferase [Candidatus Bathyarchaeia archaeon]